MMTLNETHHPDLRSWLASANEATSDFPIQNLPFAVFKRRDSDEAFRGGVAIGDQVLDLAQLVQTTPALQSELFNDLALQALCAASAPTLNEFMAMGRDAWSALRLALSRGLRSTTEAHIQSAWAQCLIAQTDVVYSVPAQIGDYTDFYTSIYHATNVGKLFRPDQPLMPNYQWIPIGYHGRASSVVISGTDFKRPVSQVKAPNDSAPRLSPSQRMDYELELGVYIGVGNDLGTTIALDDTPSHVFGLCLLNDWSARDIQAWEYQPLGPFLAKNFATSVSPWIVTLEALAPFLGAWDRPSDHPQPLPYLDSPTVRAHGSIDITLDVHVQTAAMQAQAQWHHLTRGNYRDAYWSFMHMVAHHTVNGCNLNAGDLLGTGTLSGPSLAQAGALIEITTNGKEPITLSNGEQRTFLQDGDAVKMTAFCARDGYPRIGFGEVVGRVLPADSL